MINLHYRLPIFLYIFLINLLANDGELLFHGNCITCHETKVSKSAPSIKIIQDTYKSAFTNKKDFINYMTKWVLKPDAKASLMSHAIDKYELMPELGYDKETLKEISEYIYETQF